MVEMSGLDTINNLALKAHSLNHKNTLISYKIKIKKARNLGHFFGRDEWT